MRSSAFAEKAMADEEGDEEKGHMLSRKYSALFLRKSAGEKNVRGLGDDWMRRIICAFYSGESN